MSRKPKFEALVVNAIRRLQAAQGSTASEIANYLNQEYEVAGPDVRRQIQLTIRRGVNYGILQKSKRGYVTCDRNIPEPLESLDLVNGCYSCRRGVSGGGKRRNRSRGRSSKRRRAGGKRSSKRGKGRRRGGRMRKRSASRSRRRGRAMGAKRMGGRKTVKRIGRKQQKQPVGGAEKPKIKKQPPSSKDPNSVQRQTTSAPTRGRPSSGSPTRSGSENHHES